MGESSFAHLHLHSVYSQLDGASKVSEVVAAAKADGQPGIASTEHGNLNGLIDFYKECQKQGIKYVPGQEFYFADDRTEKVKVKESAHSDLDGSDKRYYHLTVLAEDNDGYHNLMKLSSDAFLNGYFYRPRCDWSTLEQFSKGLIATTGCLGGPVLQRLLHNDFDGAVRTAARLQDIFGKDNLFVELQDHGLPEQARTNPLLIDLARKINAPLLATNDTHYTHAHDHEIHDALLCMQTGAKISDTNRFRFKSNQHWLKSAREMRSLFPEFPDACDNTLWVVERSNVEIKFGEPHLPKFTPPDGFADDYAFLEHLTFEGLKERYSGEGLQAAQERAAYELSVIRSMGFSSYFLIFWDLVNFTKREGIFTGPGRGSAASSIVAYSLGITKIDPLQHDLIFERFLNPDRISMPDIDWDIDSRYRDKLINYTREKYGEDHTAQIITFSKIKARSAVRDAARVLGYDYKLGDKIAKMMPPLVMGVSTPLHACFKETPRYEAGYRNAEPLRQLYDSDPDARKVIDVALGVEDGIRQDGIHAAGVVIGDRPLVELIPIQRKYEKGVAQPIVTQYEKDAIEDLGLLKMDFLGLRNLDVISDTLKLAGLPDDFYLNIPLDDMETFYMLQNGHGIGVFQVESPNMRQLLVRLGPNSIDDISALLALYRPGPMAENMHNDYADRKNGRQAAVPFHEDAAPILEKTYQLPIYQEQIMEISRKFAGYSMAEGDNLRKIMGKKLPEKMKEEKAKFVSGCISSGYSEEFAERLFEMIEGFSGYGFNACTTGDTVIQKASANQYGDNTMTVEQLYRLIHCRQPGSRRGGKYEGPCLSCDNGPAVKAGQCAKCASWYSQWKLRGLRILAHKDGRIVPDEVEDVVYSGQQEVWKVTLADGKSLTATADHRHLTDNGWVEVQNLKVGDKLIVAGDREHYVTNRSTGNPTGVKNGLHLLRREIRSIGACEYCGETEGRLEIAHLDSDRTNNDRENLKLLCNSCHKKLDYDFGSRKPRWTRGRLTEAVPVVSIEFAGIRDTYDVCMKGEDHSWVANGIVTHNSHSYSYGYITYWTAYLKCHYPREYMASLCTSVMDNFDKTALYLGEARRMGLSIDPPDVNSSGSKYEVSPDGIRIGLSLIRDVGEGLAERIVQERLQNGPYKSLYDFVVRVDPKSDSLQSLALAGALDAFGTRQGIYSVAKDILKQCRKDIKKNSPAQGSLFDNVEMLELDIPDTEFSWHDKLNKEKESLGMYVSGHPLADYDDLEAETTISDLKETEFEDRGRISAQKILALVSNIEVKYTKKGEAMAIVTLEDQTGQLETVCFPQAWSKIHNTIFQNGVVFAWIRPGRDFRDERNYVLSALDVVDARTQREDNQKIFGVYVPSKFNTNAKYMSKLKGILLSYPGTTPTHVFLTRNSVVELEHRFLVEPCEEMKKDIKSLFEDYNAEMKGL